MHNGRTDDPIAAAARLLADHGPPEVAQRLLAEHVPNRAGHCQGCPNQLRSVPWPCTLVAVAERVRRLRLRLVPPLTSAGTPPAPRPHLRGR